jgi:hypothetical protein
MKGSGLVHEGSTPTFSDARFRAFLNAAHDAYYG